MENNIHRAEYQKAYGIDCAVLANPTESRSALYPTFCRIPPGGSTQAHSHYEAEVFFLLSGQGTFDAGKERAVGAGDLIRIPPFTRHQLRNAGPEELKFLSVYSEDNAVPALPTRALLTAAPPTPNGPLHLGHLSGPYLAADVLRRYLGQRGVPLRALTGTDDHQNYVGAAAKAQERSLEACRSHYRHRILAGFERAAIQFDEVSETRQPESVGAAQAFFRRALAQGVFREQVLPLPYCEACAQFLLDASLVGRCPHCGESSHGGCEACGLVALPTALLDPHCAACGKSAATREHRVHTFDLSAHLPAILPELQLRPMAPRLRAVLEAIQGERSFQVLITHPDPAGVPVDPERGLHLHVWAEMAAHYEPFAHGKAEWIHFFGFDNGFYYLLFIPALLRALDAKAKLPDVFVANAFLQLEGRKFSTSRRHAIWADEFEDDPDHLRFFLSLHRPAEREENFRPEDFRAFSAELTALLARARECSQDGLAPRSTVKEINRYVRELERLYAPESFDLRRAARRLLEMLDWIGGLEEQGLAIRAFANAAAPIAPGLAANILKAESPPGWVSDWGMQP